MSETSDQKSDEQTDQNETQPAPGDSTGDPAPGPVGDSAGAVVKRLGPAAALAAVWMFMPAIGGFVLLANMEPVSAWFSEHGAWSWAVYAGLFTLTAGLGVLPTYAQAVLGGYAFGPVVGTAAALAGFVGASSVGRVVGSRVSGDRVEKELDRHPKWGAVRDALIRSGFWRRLGLVTLVRVPPNSPFALTNLVLTTAGVPWTSYLIATAVGMLPRTAAAVVIGSQISDWGELGKPKWMIVGGIVSVIVVVLVIGQVAHNAIEKFSRSAGADQDLEQR